MAKSYSDNTVSPPDDKSYFIKQIEPKDTGDESMAVDEDEHPLDNSNLQDDVISQYEVRRQGRGKKPRPRPKI